MSIDSILKKEGIVITKQLPTLQVNLIANNIATLLCKTFPEHQFNKQSLFTKLSRLSMYFAKMPKSLSCAKYVSENSSIYFSEEMSLESINEVFIHECIHFLQEIKNKEGKLVKLGLADFRQNKGIALNEAAVQLMAAQTCNTPIDTVTYYDITLPTNSPSYYTLQCVLVKQMTIFTGEYPLFHSMITGNSVFKNTFIKKTNKKTYEEIQENLDKLVTLEDLLCQQTNDLQIASSNIKKIATINNAIKRTKENIFYLFLKTQNLIMTTCFYNELNRIKKKDQIANLRNKLYQYKYYIGTNEKYTFYNEFYQHMMNLLEKKEEFILEHEKNLFNIQQEERALVLIDNRNNVFSFIRTLIKKLIKVNSLKQEVIKETSDF